jgi:DNA-binding transcriptional MerR regulator
MARYKGLRIGATALLLGVSVGTLRDIEQSGRLPATPRTKGGHRLYYPKRIAEISYIIKGDKNGR